MHSKKTEAACPSDRTWQPLLLLLMPEILESVQIQLMWFKCLILFFPSAEIR